YIVAAYDLSQRCIDRRVFQRSERSRQNCLRECTDQIASSRGDGGRPALLTHTCGPIALVERIQPGRESVTEHDCFAADGFGYRGVLTLRMARTVDTTAERERSCVEAFGQTGFSGTDDAREHEVWRGDEAACVEHPWVVDEGPTR